MTEKNHNHLNEFQLNEYLDDCLDPEDVAILEMHISDCPACAARLESLRTVFKSLDDLPDIPLMRDLSVDVVSALQHELHFSKRLKWGAVAQAALTFVVLVLAVPTLLRTWQPIFGGVQLTLSSQFSNILLTWTTYWTAQFGHWQLTWSQMFSEWHPPTLFSATQTAIWPIFLAAILLFVIGNGLILRKVVRNGIH